MPTRFSLRLFGTFEARACGSPLPHLRTRRGEWLLTLLALRAGQAVERGWLAGTLWPQSREAQALSNLRESLCDLRRALGAAAGCLLSPSPRTLALDLALTDVDVVTFDAALARGDLPSLEEAVALYRGPLLEGCTEEWVFQERRQREEACLGALEALAAAALGASDFPRAERHLRRAIGIDPLRESAQRALMQALAAGGSYAAALQVYRELRLLLHREINAEPDAETTARFQQLRTEAREKAGAGVKKAAIGASQSALAIGSRHNLPAQTTLLIGRQQEVTGVRDRLLEQKIRLLTLTGPGGTGKTRLALQVAAELLDDFADGVFFVSLAPIRDPELVPSAVAQILGVRETEGRSLLQGLKEYLREKQMLLLLDNFEQVLEAAPVVSELLAAAPRLKILVTSRAVLHLNGEYDVPVPPLALPPLADGQWSGTREAGGVDGSARSKMGRPSWGPSTINPPLSTLIRYAAVELFIERAVAARPDFMVTNENAPAVAEICARLDGLPLAIELAAARIKLFSPRALLSRLERRLPLLVGGARDLPARQQTLRSAIGWSYDLLAEEEKTLFRRLSVFLGGCTLGAAEAVCNAEGDLGIDVLDGLAALADKSLLREEPPPASGCPAREAGGGEPRFGMLETIREYGLERLAQSGEETAVRQQHAQFFLALAEEAEPELRGPEQVVWLDRLESEHDNLRAALKAVDSGQWLVEAGLWLGGVLWWFWWMRGYWTEGREHLSGLLALPGAKPHTAARARALHGAAMLAWAQGDGGAARALAEENLALSRELGYNPGIAGSLSCLGWVAHGQGDFDAMRALFEESLTLSRELGDKQGVAGSLYALARASLGQGDHGATRRLYEQSLEVYRALGHTRGIADVLSGLGSAALARGDCGEACVRYQESLVIYRELGHKQGIADVLAGLGNLALARGDYRAARALHEERLAIWRELSHKPGIAWALDHLGRAARGQGDHEAARVLWEESLAISRELGFKLTIARSLQGLGWAAQARGDHEAAWAHCQEGLAIFRELGHKRGIAQSLEGLAVAAAAHGQSERAARLFGAAEGLRETLSPRQPMGADWVPAVDEERLAAVRAALGEEAFAAACAAGRAMSLEEALTLALEQPKTDPAQDLSSGRQNNTPVGSDGRLTMGECR